MPFSVSLNGHYINQHHSIRIRRRLTVAHSEREVLMNRLYKRLKNISNTCHISYLKFIYFLKKIRSIFITTPTEKKNPQNDFEMRF